MANTINKLNMKSKKYITHLDNEARELTFSNNDTKIKIHSIDGEGLINIKITLPNGNQVNVTTSEHTNDVSLYSMTTNDNSTVFSKKDKGGWTDIYADDNVLATVY